ncbi:sigma-70 family RNA polymerase sigma factor [Phycisphaerales bacterium ac7]
MEHHPDSHASKPSNPTVSRGREALQSVMADERTQAALEFRLARYAERGRLSEEDLADLRQDLWLELVRAFERFDQDRSSPGTFARRVADRWLKHRARADIAHQQRHRRAARGYVDRAAASIEPGHDALDVRAVLEALPESDAALLSSYRHWSVTEIADSRGLNRSATHRRLRTISNQARRRFPRMALEFSDLRNAAASGAETPLKRHRKSVSDDCKEHNR